MESLHFVITALVYTVQSLCVTEKGIVVADAADGMFVQGISLGYEPVTQFVVAFLPYTDMHRLSKI